MFTTIRYSKRWPLTPLETLNSSRTAAASPYDETGVDKWLLHIPDDAKKSWGAIDASGEQTFSCQMCEKCVSRITRKKPEFPCDAIANDRWGGPVPEEIQCLSFAEKRILQRARTYLSLKRASESRIKKKSTQHWVSQGRTAMSYLQEPETLMAACMLLPEELCESLHVQFVGPTRDVVRKDQSLQVSVARLRAAFV